MRLQIGVDIGLGQDDPSHEEHQGDGDAGQGDGGGAGGAQDKTKVHSWKKFKLDKKLTGCQAGVIPHHHETKLSV